MDGRSSSAAVNACNKEMCLAGTKLSKMLKKHFNKEIIAYEQKERAFRAQLEAHKKQINKKLQQDQRELKRNEQAAGRLEKTAKHVFNFYL